MIDQSPDPRLRCGCSAAQPAIVPPGDSGEPWSGMTVAFAGPNPSSPPCAEPKDEGGAFSDSPPEESPLRSLIAMEGLFSHGATISFRVFRRDDSVPSQDRQRALCKATETPTIVGLSCEYEYDGDPPFSPPGSPGYSSRPLDEHGTVSVWRPLRYDVLSAPDMHWGLMESEYVFIARTGEVARKVRTILKLVEPIGSSDGLVEYQQLKVALGATFSEYLESIDSVVSKEDGIRELRGAGNYGPTLPGTWDVRFGIESGYSLVREATFISATEGQVVLKVGSSGTLAQDGFILPAVVWLTYPRMSITEFTRYFEIIEACSEPEEGHLRELRELLTEKVPADVPVVDWSR